MTARVKAILVALGIAAVAVGAFVATRPSDEDRIRQTLDRLAKAVSVRVDDNAIARAARVKSELAETVDDDARAEIDELDVRVTGRKQLAERAMGAGAVFGEASCTLTQVKVQLDPSRTAAKADAIAIVTGTRGGERRVDRRDVHFLLRKDGGWRVTSIRVLPDATP